MKVLHDLMECIDEFLYNPLTNSIFFVGSYDTECKTTRLYNEAVALIEREDQKECNIRAYRKIKYGNMDAPIMKGDKVVYVSHKWMLDVALNEVRTLSERDRVYLNKHMRYIDYHIGYAINIRNKYIFPLNYYREEAEGISKIIMEIIFSIIDPDYDFRNPECVGYYDSSLYRDLSEEYEEMLPDIFATVKNTLLAENSSMTANEALSILSERLKERLGDLELSRVLKAFMTEYDKKKENRDEDWYWKYLWPKKAVLFPLAARQIQCLKDFYVLNWVKNGYGFPRITLNNLEDCIEKCKELIDRELGFKEESTDLIAKSFVYAFMSEDNETGCDENAQNKEG